MVAAGGSAHAQCRHGDA